MDIEKLNAPFFLHKLREEFGLRQKNNINYSLRGFARFLEIQPPTLSAVLNEKRPLPYHIAERVAQRLQLSPSEKLRFINSIKNRSLQNKKDASQFSQTSPYQLKEEAHFKVISEWEHYAILSLCRLNKFKSDPQWIAQQLGITIERTKTCIENLVDSGLLSVNNGKLERVYSSVNTSSDVISSALKKAHREAIRLAFEKLEIIPIELRDFSTNTFPIKKENLLEAKLMIQQFNKDFSRFIESEEGDHVYQINIQFFPLTDITGGSLE